MQPRKCDPAQWIASAVLTIGLLSVLLVSGCAAPQGRPTLMVFTSPNCVACMQDVLVVKKIATMGLVTLDVVVAEEQPATVEQYGVTTLPTYVVWYDGRELYRTNQAELARRYIVSLYK